jgi:hypothetical protein
MLLLHASRAGVGARERRAEEGRSTWWIRRPTRVPSTVPAACVPIPSSGEVDVLQCNCESVNADWWAVLVGSFAMSVDWGATPDGGPKVETYLKD